MSESPPVFPRPTWLCFDPTLASAQQRALDQMRDEMYRVTGVPAQMLGDSMITDREGGDAFHGMDAFQHQQYLAWARRTLEASGATAAPWYIDRPSMFSAQKKALALLNESLSPEQRQSYLRDRCFFVTGASGTRYRIRHGTVGNIDHIGRDGKVEGTWCGLPNRSMPTEDVLLAQKLSLETDDYAFRRIARSGLANGTYQLLPPLRFTPRQLLPTLRLPHPVRIGVLAVALNVAAILNDLVGQHPHVLLAAINFTAGAVVSVTTYNLHRSLRRRTPLPPP